MTCSAEINLAWQGERKQLAECAESIFPFIITICMKFWAGPDHSGAGEPFQKEHPMNWNSNEEHTKILGAGADFCCNEVIVFLSMLSYVG